jgi:SAM-dependent methyltransferase
MGEPARAHGFGADPRAFFDEVYREAAPWDIGDAQPALLQLVDDFPPKSPILDVGCGSGDLAIALARRGHDVLGVDFAERAIVLARDRSAALSPEVARRLRFAVADALTPSRLGERFAAVVDSGFLHVLGQDDRDRFADDLARVLLPRGRYYLVGFATEFDMPNTPRRVTEAELRARFASARGWDIRVVRPAEFVSRFAPVPSVAACIERVSG